MPVNRGLEDIVPRLDDFVGLVEQRVSRGYPVRILEAGCGYGMAMLGLVKKFGSNVDIVGFNSSERHGTIEIMKSEAIKTGLFSKNELDQIQNLPDILFLDASEDLPFDSQSFDFIYSINSMHYYDDKIHFLEECNRVLKTRGIARIAPAFGEHYFGVRKGSPEKYPGFWEIWDAGKEVNAWEYLRNFEGVRVVYNPGTAINDGVPQYIEIKSQAELDFRLRLVSSIDLNFLWQGYSGVRSIYSTQLKFTPQWKDFL